MSRRLALLAVLLATFLAVVTYYRLPPGTYGNDGSYYAHIAQHLAQGDGFVTRVSLANQGLRSMPAPATIYPVWPLVLALVERTIGLESSAWILSAILALTALGSLYALAGVIGRRFGDRAEVLGAVGGYEITTGHVVVALVMLNRGFIDATLLPITEPLALTLIFAALLALDRSLRGSWPAAWAALSGVLASLAYLTRFQAAPLVLVIPAALFLVSRHDPRFRLPLAASIVATAVVLVPWIAYLQMAVGLRPMMLFDFTAYRESPELPPGPTHIADTGLWSRIGVVFRSLADGFLPSGRGRRSYRFAFGWIALAVPVGALFAVVRRVKRGVWPLSGDAAVVPLAAVAAGVGMLAPLHLSVVFEVRHRLPFVLLLVVALPLLNGALQERARSAGARPPAGTWFRRALRAALLAIALFSVVAGATRLRRDDERLRTLIPTFSSADRDAGAWLDDHASLVAVVLPQRLALATQNTTFHWIGCRSRPRAVIRVLDVLPIDHVVIRRSQTRCLWTSVIPADATPVAFFDDGVDALSIYRAADVRSFLVDRKASRAARRGPVPVPGDGQDEAAEEPGVTP